MTWSRLSRCRSSFNPFSSGRVFRRVPRPLKGEVVGVSIPLERGRVFRHMTNYMNILNLLVSIPLEQGRVFRHASLEPNERGCYMFQSLQNRAGSFDGEYTKAQWIALQFQSLWNRARSFDEMYNIYAGSDLTFQSLWRRAGLSTNISTFILLVLVNLNPFGTGRVFRRTERIKPIYSPLFQSLWSRAGSFDDCCFCNAVSR